MTFTRSTARRTATITFRHVDGTEQGGAISGSLAETFSVVSHPRYGDTVARRFRYAEVAEVTASTPRVYAALPTFDHLMRGIS